MSKIRGACNGVYILGIKWIKAQSYHVFDTRRIIMSEQETKPTVEQEIKTHLSGDLQKNALNFVAYMNASSTKKHLSGWEHLSGDICFIVVDPGHLYVYFGHNKTRVCFRASECNGDIYSYPLNQSMKEFIWNNINQCNHFRTNGEICGCGQQPGLSFVLLGKKIDNLCNCPVCFVDPTADTFDKIKKMVEAWKICIEANQHTE